MGQRRGFTLIELMVVIAIIALLVTMLVPTLTKVQELGKRAVCGTRQKSISTALGIYTSDDTNNNYPWMTSTNTATSWIDTTTGTNRDQKPSTSVARNVTSLLFLLVRSGQPANLFVCPSATDKIGDDNTKDANGEYYWDFASADNVGYSYQLPYQAGTKIENGLSGKAPAELAILSDESPYITNTTLTPINWATPPDDKTRVQHLSQNHAGGEVIQVLFLDSHVANGQRAANVGPDKDAIFTASSSSTGGSQQGVRPTSLAQHLSPKDSVLWGPK